MPYVSIPSVPRGDDLALQRGDTWAITMQRLGDVSGRDELWFTLKDDKDDADASALVQIDESTGLLYINGVPAGTPANGSIVVTDAAKGNLTINLAAVEAAKLADVGNLYYDVQLLDDPAITTLVRGRAVVMGDSTLAVA